MTCVKERRRLKAATTKGRAIPDASFKEPVDVPFVNVKRGPNKWKGAQELGCGSNRDAGWFPKAANVIAAV